MALPYDILEIIFDKCDFISQIHLYQTSIFTYDVLQMTNFYDIPIKLQLVLKPQILQHYPHIKRLNLQNNVVVFAALIRVVALLVYHKNLSFVTHHM